MNKFHAAFLGVVAMLLIGCGNDKQRQDREPTISSEATPNKQASSASPVAAPPAATPRLVAREDVEKFYAKLVNFVRNRSVSQLCDLMSDKLNYRLFNHTGAVLNTLDKNTYCSTTDASFRNSLGSVYDPRFFPVRITYDSKQGSYADLEVVMIVANTDPNTRRQLPFIATSQTLRLGYDGKDLKAFYVTARIMPANEVHQFVERMKRG